MKEGVLKRTGLFVLAAMILGLTPVALAAQPPAASFFPDEDGSNVSTSAYLSDRPDGMDASVHLTLVANEGTDQAQWYLCPVAVNDPPTQTQLASCSTIGSDPSARRPTGVISASPPDKAYELHFDVPAALDLAQRDLVALACTGPGRDIEGTDANCSVTNEVQVVLDDASTAGTASETTSGAITSICVADLNGPGSGESTGDDPCEVQPGATPLTSDQRAVVDSRFTPLAHGSVVPNEGFVIRVSTSADMIGSGVLRAARDFGADAGFDPTVAEQDVGCTRIASASQSATWECVFPPDGLNRDADSEQAVWAYETSAVGSGEGLCAGAACTLDALYVVSADLLEIKAARLGFGSTDACLVLGEPAADGMVSRSVTMSGCMTGPGPEEGRKVTFESAGVGEISGCPGSSHDHDKDSDADDCHALTDASGRVSSVVLSNGTGSGRQILTFCEDAENGVGLPPGASLPAGHGCAGEVRSSGTVTWSVLPSNVHLAVLDEALEDPCDSGSSNALLLPGDRVELIACVTGGPGSEPASTLPEGAGHLLWSATPAEPQVVRFVQPPPSETGGDGTASVLVEARVAARTAAVEVSLCDASGFCGRDGSAVEIQVGGTAEEDCSDGIDNDSDGHVDFPDDSGCDSYLDPDEEALADQVSSNVTLRRSDEGFRGRVGSAEPSCRSGRLVAVRKKARGPDPLVGRDRTDALGRWQIEASQRRGAYYAVARAESRNLPDPLLCLRARSEVLRLG